MEAITTESLTKVFRSHLGKRGAPSVDGLDLAVRENEIFGFLGRNGAGKTTTIKMLCSLLRPTKGRARICGEDARKRAARRHIGYLPENPYFYEYLTPRETISFYGELHGLNPAAQTTQWNELSERLQLDSIADQRVRGFSKGMRQRLGFAVALVGDPSVLILDEPMSGLDPLGRRLIRELILQLRCEGKTIFFSSHVLGDVEQICDRVGILVKGQLTTQGRLDELLSRHINRVEVITTGLSEEAVAELAKTADASRSSEAGQHFGVANLDRANDLARRVHALGGTLIEFAPVKESLEEYFMREQEAEI